MLAKFLKSKKAVSGDVYLSPWMVLIWAIIGVSIVIGVLMFFNFEVDSRTAEANLLASRVLECFSDNLDYTLLQSPDFNIYDFCKINKGAIEKTDLYFFRISFIELPEDKVSFSLSGGLSLFETQCDYQKSGKPEKNFPKCAYGQSYSTDKKTGKQYNLLVVAASNQK